MSTALVTGGTGFIGSHTVEQLLRRGIAVRCLVRPFRKNLSWLEHLPVERVAGDLLDPPSIARAVDGADFVIHVAGVTKARHRSEYFDGNVVATRNLLEAVTKSGTAKKFCYVSSLTATGPSPDGRPVDERTVCKPLTSYGRSKFEGELACRQFAPSLPVVIVRPPSVYGPRDKDVLELFRAAQFGVQPNVGSKNRTVSLIFGPDLAEGIVEATLSEKTASKTYFVSDPRIYLLSEMYDIISSLVGSRSLRLRLPRALLFSAAAVTEFLALFGKNPALLSIDKARDLSQDHWVCSPEAIRVDIGFEAKTSAQEGLRQTYEWYRGNKWL